MQAAHIPWPHSTPRRSSIRPDPPGESWTTGEATKSSPGDACNAVMYIKRGGVKLSVRSRVGVEAIVAMLGPGEFLGEGCLAGQRIRVTSATALTPSTVLQVDKRRMLRVLREQHALSDRLIATCSRHMRASRKT